MRAVRVLFDTNIWRYLADADAVRALEVQCKRRKLQVVMPPATAFEVAQTADPALRQALLHVVCKPVWKRLMPEAYTSSLELVAELKRCRPQWMLPKINKHKLQPLFRDWKAQGGFWRRVCEYPDRFHEELRDKEWMVLSGAREQAYRRRDDFSQQRLTKLGPLDKWFGSYSAPRVGWDGGKIEHWRMESEAAVKFSLTALANATHDWVSCYAALDHIDFEGKDWLRFWLYDCSRERMPLQWLWWAMGFLQGYRRTTDGNPGDVQLGQYLPECDLFVTADRNFGWVVEQCRPYSVCSLPDVHVVRGGTEGLHQIADLLGITY